MTHSGGSDSPRVGLLDERQVAALTLAFCGQAESKLGDAIPADVWAELHRAGFVRTAHDFAGEGVTVPTEAGYATLKEAIS